MKILFIAYPHQHFTKPVEDLQSYFLLMREISVGQVQVQVVLFFEIGIFVVLQKLSLLILKLTKFLDNNWFLLESEFLQFSDQKLDGLFVYVVGLLLLLYIQVSFLLNRLSNVWYIHWWLLLIIYFGEKKLWETLLLIMLIRSFLTRTTLPSFPMKSTCSNSSLET